MGIYYIELDKDHPNGTMDKTKPTEDTCETKMRANAENVMYVAVTFTEGSLKNI